MSGLFNGTVICRQLAKASDDHYVWKIFYYDPNVWITYPIVCRIRAFSFPRDASGWVGLSTSAIRSLGAGLQELLLL